MPYLSQVPKYLVLIIPQASIITCIALYFGTKTPFHHPLSSLTQILFCALHSLVVRCEYNIGLRYQYCILLSVSSHQILFPPPSQLISAHLPVPTDPNHLDPPLSYQTHYSSTHHRHIASTRSACPYAPLLGPRYLAPSDAHIALFLNPSVRCNTQKLIRVSATP